MITTCLRDFIAAHTREIQIETGVALIILCGPDPEEALSALARVREAANDLEARLIAEGSDMDLGSRAEWQKEYNLSTLSLMSSPKSIALLEAILSIMPIAEAVDAERGRTIADCFEPGPGESRGTDYAEALATLRLRLSAEIKGVPGSAWE